MKTKERETVGRSPKYTTSQVLQEKIDEYFATGVRIRKILVGPANNRSIAEFPIPTITGLILYCGFSSRQSFYDYEEKDEFTYTIKKARTRIEREYEEQLQCGLGAGAIFALKNFGWKDERTETKTEEHYHFTTIVQQIRQVLEKDGEPKTESRGVTEALPSIPA